MNEPVEPTPPPERPHQNPKTKPKHHRLKETFSTLGIIILAPLVALLLTAFVFQSYQVDGPSMESTLHNGDRLIVTKTGRTFARITRNDYVPKRYDIVIFNHTGEFGDGNFVSEKQLIKRVMGLPGDRVVVKDGTVTIFNKEHPNGFSPDSEGPQKNVIGNTPGSIDETVKNGELYVMGDNRENSLDSRSFGAIRSSDLVGKLSLRVYPFDQTDKF